MKKIISITAIIVVLSLIIALVGLYSVNGPPKIKNAKNVSKITVLSYPWFKTKTTENKNEITTVVNYINGLDLKKTSKQSKEKLMGGYDITCYFNHKIAFINFTTIRKFYLGDYINEVGRKNWYDAPFQQKEEFRAIFYDLDNK